MARNYPADTRGQRVLEELYEKEQRAQLNWFIKSEKAKKDNPGKVLTPAAIADTQAPTLEEVLPPHLLEKVRQAQLRQQSKPTLSTLSCVPGKVADSSEEPKPDMVPPDKSTQMILYDGISKEGKGRSETCKSKSSELYSYNHRGCQTNLRFHIESGRIPNNCSWSLLKQ